MKDIKLILTDLDGTLFHDNKTISDYTKQIIKKVQQKGILFGISTSRAIINITKFTEGFSPDFIISNGGALVTVNNQQIYSCPFSLEETQKILSTAYSVLGEEIEMTIDTIDSLYWNKKQAEQSTSYDKTAKYCDFHNFPEPAMKICIQSQDKNSMIQIAESIGKENVDLLPFSDIPWYKLSNKNATKDRAIIELSKFLNIPTENMASFGDDFNDIEMLKICGVGVAMENAIPEVKASANEITTSNENDGVARWLEKNVL